MDVIFNCPHCGKELEVDASYAGDEVPCPACYKKIRIPAAGAGGPTGWLNPFAFVRAVRRWFRP